MSKIYDKIILMVALLILAGGLAIYFTGGAEAERSAPPMGGGSYEPVSVTIPEEPEASWPEPEPQDGNPLELFDLFTPPKIYLTSDGRFDFVPPPEAIDIEEIDFPVYLVRLEREPYRIQLEGYIEDDLADASKSLLLFYDEEQGKSVRARVGAEKPEHEFKVLGFEIDRSRDADNNVTITAEATLLDTRSDDEVVLTHGQRRFEDEITVVLGVEDSEQTFEFNEEGARFEVEEASYVLREINLEDSSVTVEKLGDEELEPVLRVLRADEPSNQSASRSDPQSINPQSDTEPSEVPFDFFE